MLRPRAQTRSLEPECLDALTADRRRRRDATTPGAIGASGTLIAGPHLLAGRSPVLAVDGPTQ
jgi:hypothetical protein